MKGLLLKDFYMTQKYCKMFLFMVVLFMAMAVVKTDNLFLLAYPAILMGMIPVNLLAYDEREKWDRYSAVLPCTRAQIVSVKYLMGLIIAGALFLLTMVVFGIRAAVGNGFAVQENLELVAVILSLGLISPMIVLPFSFKLGSEKGRVAYIVCVALLCGAAYVLSAGDLPIPDVFHLKMTPLLLLTVIAVLYVVSWRISIWFYNKKEL